jgi:hypothetical protein
VGREAACLVRMHVLVSTVWNGCRWMDGNGWMDGWMDGWIFIGGCMTHVFVYGCTDVMQFCMIGFDISFLIFHVTFPFGQVTAAMTRRMSEWEEEEGEFEGAHFRDVRSCEYFLSYFPFVDFATLF